MRVSVTIKPIPILNLRDAAKAPLLRDEVTPG
jgi:hypothetical protein